MQRSMDIVWVEKGLASERPFGNKSKREGGGKKSGERFRLDKKLITAYG